MKNHVKWYDDDILEKLESYYTITFDSDSERILVSGKRRPNRITYHSIKENFKINFFKLNKLMTISKEAIDMWLQIGVEDYTLISVQNAMNYLYITYQDITKEKILKILNKGEV